MPWQLSPLTIALGAIIILALALLCGAKLIALWNKRRYRKLILRRLAEDQAYCDEQRFQRQLDALYAQARKLLSRKDSDLTVKPKPLF